MVKKLYTALFNMQPSRLIYSSVTEMRKYRPGLFKSVTDSRNVEKAFQKPEPAETLSRTRLTWSGTRIGSYELIQTHIFPDKFAYEHHGSLRAPFSEMNLVIQPPIHKSLKG